MNIKKILFAFLSSFLIFAFVSCSTDSGDSDSSGIQYEGNDEEIVYPLISESRKKSLDFIFSTQEIADINITITQEQWNELLSNYDQNPKNEEYVKADFKMEKGELEWQIENIGFRLRGNTSRCRPQLETGEFQQAHFKLDFEEFSKTDKKLSGCIKGLNLKRFKDDPTYSREIYCYNYFRDCGIWTAPRASYAHLFIIITDYNSSSESENPLGSTGTVSAPKTLDYGIYAMIEDINKQFLKARTTEENAGDFKNNKGSLWKCTYTGPGKADFAGVEDSKFGVEKIDLDESKSERYTYDLKADKKKFDEAKTQLVAFITELNALSDSDTNAIKQFYEEKMDVDLFIKTYAINVILGMDDDYWRNGNNFYFYFDKSGKAYFIPYDYDNTLGTGCFGDTATKSPLEWGEGGGNAPLMEKLLKVPEYLSLYKKYLVEYSDSESGFEVLKSQKRINEWQQMIEPYIKSPDLTYGKSATTDHFEDSVAMWCHNYNNNNYKLLSGDETNNYFMAKTKAIKYFVSE